VIPLSPPKRNANSRALAFRFGSVLFSLFFLLSSLYKCEDRKAIFIQMNRRINLSAEKAPLPKGGWHGECRDWGIQKTLFKAVRK